MPNAIAVKQHSELGASSADRWMKCPGSVRLSRGMPDHKSVYSIQGDAAHELMERCLTTGSPPSAFLGASFQGVEVDDEMVEALEVYAGHITALAATDPNAEVWPERRFDLKALNPPGPMWGTSDTPVWLPATRWLHVNDLKYGKGVAVDVIGNPQLLYYALGATLSLPLGYVPERITLTIIQPRASHSGGIVRSHTITLRELLDFTEDLMEAARRTQEPDAPLVPGPWCRFCRAAPVCPALGAKAMAVAQTEFDAVVPDLPKPEGMPKELLLNVLDHREMIESWFNSIAAYVSAKEESEPGFTEGRYKVVEKRANRKWASEPAVVKFAQDRGLEPDELYTQKLKSPAQLEKVVGKKNLPAELVVKEASGTVLVPGDDPRPAHIARVTEFEVLPAPESD